jgi:predicted DNA-binding transcriptional regulator YafY
MAYDPESRGNLVVYDMAKQGYRTIKLDRLQSVRVRGREVTF